jgi:hypothetical protein
MWQQFNTFQFFDFLKTFLKFSSPCVDKRYLVEVTRAFGSLAMGTFGAKLYTISLVVENIPPH